MCNFLYLYISKLFWSIGLWLQSHTTTFLINSLFWFSNWRIPKNKKEKNVCQVLLVYLIFRCISLFLLQWNWINFWINYYFIYNNLISMKKSLSVWRADFFNQIYLEHLLYEFVYSNGILLCSALWFENEKKNIQLNKEIKQKLLFKR